MKRFQAGLLAILMASALLAAPIAKAESVSVALPITNVVDWSKANAVGSALRVFKQGFSLPRKLKVSAVRIDLKTPGLRFVGTHRDPKWGEPMPDSDKFAIRTKRVTTAEFYAEEYRAGHKLLCAFNTSPWLPWDDIDHIYAHPRGVNLDGTNVISGKVGANAAMFVAWRDGRCTIQERLSPAEIGEVALAHSGWRIILKDGVNRQNPADVDCHPRMVVGLSADGNYLYVLAVDGRQPGWSEGASVWECAELMRALGADDAINMDGGGSTTLLLGNGKKVKYLNRLNFINVGWRRNAMNLGVYIE